MSFNRIIPHETQNYLEAIIEGHEDWLSAVRVIEQIVAASESLSINRVLLDFSEVDMRVAVVEAPVVAQFFSDFAGQTLTLAVIYPRNPRGVPTVKAFVAGMEALGHTAVIIECESDRIAWITGSAHSVRRAS